MTICVTIGSYRLLEFVELNICQVRRCLGEEVPICVSDDESDQSGRMEQLCERRGVYYLKSRARRGHFAGDFQAIITSLQFARAQEAELAVKLSQRFILRTSRCREVLAEAFADPQIVLALPGRMSPQTLRLGGSAGFTMMPVMTDIVCFRVGAVEPEVLIGDYREKCATENFKWSQWVESTCASWKEGRFKERTYSLEALTNHQPGVPPIYLRRNQNSREQYLELARRHSICGSFELGEWSRMEAGYWPMPLAV